MDTSGATGAAATGDVEAALPPGWYAEPSANGTYYWREDGTVQWERPTLPAPSECGAATSSSQPSSSWSGSVQSSSTRDSILVVKQAAAAGAPFVACAFELGVEVAGYAFSRDGASGTGYYRQPDAPPPDDAAYSRIVLQRASAAGASFIALEEPLDGFTLDGYVHGDGLSGRGYYRQRAATPPPAASTSATGSAAAPSSAVSGAATATAAAATSADATTAAASSAGASCAASSSAASHSDAAAAAPLAAAAPAAPPTAAEVAAWCAAHEVGLSEGCPAPLISFGACAHARALPPPLLGELAAVGFSEPSPIQAAAWAAALSGADLVGIARTGSGKTLAYLAPAFASILADAAGLVLPTPTALVLAPTRELAVQVRAPSVARTADSPHIRALASQIVRPSGSTPTPTPALPLTRTLSVRLSD